MMKPDYFLDEEEDDDVREAGKAGDVIDFDDDGESTDTTAEATAPRRVSGFVKWAVLVVGVVLGSMAYLRYGTPFVSGVTDEVYILSVQREGYLFKTVEGEMVSRRELVGSGLVHSVKWRFSVDDEALFEPLQSAKLSGKPLIVEVERYRCALPWRGSSTTVITGIK